MMCAETTRDFFTGGISGCRPRTSRISDRATCVQQVLFDVMPESKIHALPKWSLPIGIVHAVFPSRRGLSPAVRSFIDFLASSFVLEGYPNRMCGTVNADLFRHRLIRRQHTPLQESPGAFVLMAAILSWRERQHE
jgi:hypothetical protein